MDYNFITILGPTAVGKTKLAAQLAAFFNGEIISADSRQVYRKMDIGTGKDYDDYVVDKIKIPYHLIDIIDPVDEFNLFKFIQAFNESFVKIIKKNKIPFLTGGTGMYLESVLKGYELKKTEYDLKRKSELEIQPHDKLKKLLLMLNSELHNTTDTLVKERIIEAILLAESKSGVKVIPLQNLNSLTIGVKSEMTEIREKITKRLKQRLNEGMVEEVEQLMNEGITAERLKLFGLEYKFISQYILSELSYNDMYQKLNSAIHKFAKRQMTWFRKMERDGVAIYWVESGDYKSAKTIIEKNNFLSYA